MAMAVTGIVFVGFVLVHMYGNLMAFGGRLTYDTYAHHIRTFLQPMLPYGAFLVVLDAVLITAVIIHIFAAVKLTHRAIHARPIRYAVKKNVKSTLSSRWMRWGGAALLLFILFHILEFTTHSITPGGDSPDPFVALTNAFQLWWVFVIYLLALIALAMHLRHGVWSACQTLGWTSSALSRRVAKIAGIGLALVISVGFAITPLFILVGVIK